MHENIAVVDSHLELKLALQQKNICSPFMGFLVAKISVQLSP